MIKQYSIGEKIQNVYYLLFTKIFFKNARLIRRPFYCRGKKNLKFGEGFTTGRFCRFDLLSANQKVNSNEPTLIFGARCKLGDSVHIVASKKITIGNDCLFASKIFISDTSHGYYRGESPDSPLNPPDKRDLVTSKVIIGNRVWIGENVTILPGVHIGDGSIVGANAVVTKSVPENSIVAGNPAQVIKVFNLVEKRWESKR